MGSGREETHVTLRHSRRLDMGLKLRLSGSSGEEGSQLGPTPIESKGRTRRQSKIAKFIFGRY